MAENSMFSNWDNVVSDGRNDLVFENRNKEYGAFDIRRKYNNYVNRALIISCLSFVLLVSAPKIYSWIVQRLSVQQNKKTAYLLKHISSTNAVNKIVFFPMPPR